MGAEVVAGPARLGILAILLGTAPAIPIAKERSAEMTDVETAAELVEVLSIAAMGSASVSLIAKIKTAAVTDVKGAAEHALLDILAIQLENVVSLAALEKHAEITDVEGAAEHAQEHTGVLMAIVYAALIV